MVLVRHHKTDETFLPALQYITYTASALGWSWLVMVFAIDVLGFGPVADWMAVVLPWFMFVGPWFVFRRHGPTPVVADAALVTLAVVLVIALSTSSTFLLSTHWLPHSGYLAPPIPIGVTALVLHRLKKAGIPELWGAAAWAVILLAAAAILFPH